MRRIEPEMLWVHHGGFRNLIKAETLVFDSIVPDDGESSIEQLDVLRDEAVESLQRETEALVARLWPAIEALQSVLVERKLIWGPEAAGIIERALRDTAADDEPPSPQSQGSTEQS